MIKIFKLYKKNLYYVIQYIKIIYNYILMLVHKKNIFYFLTITLIYNKKIMINEICISYI